MSNFPTVAELRVVIDRVEELNNEHRALTKETGRIAREGPTDRGIKRLQEILVRRAEINHELEDIQRQVEDDMREAGVEP